VHVLWVCACECPARQLFVEFLNACIGAAEEELQALDEGADPSTLVSSFRWFIHPVSQTEYATCVVDMCVGHVHAQVTSDARCG